MKSIKGWKRVGAALMILSLLSGSVQGLLIQAEEQPVMVSEKEAFEKEEQTENRESGQDETEQILTEPETEKESEKQSEPQTGQTKEEENESGLENEETGLTETDSEDDSEEHSEKENETGTGEMTESGTEEGKTESETESESENESESETEDPYGIETYAMTLTPSGSPVSQTEGWSQITSADRFSSDFLPVKFYKGISSLEVFNSSSEVVVGTTDNGRTYLYPKTTGQGGTFGAIYRKVLYSNHRWYDLRMTVTNYTSKIHYDGGGTMESYPFILMLPTVIEWRFIQSIGGLVMKCEFLDSATGAVTPVNTRFQWWDVDSAQRFGLKTGDGSIAGKYYYSGSKLYVESGATMAGVKNLEMLVGPGEDSETVDPQYCATFELQNCSTYYMAIGPRDHMDNDNYSYSKSHVKELNEKLANATANEIDSSQTLMQTDTSLTIIDTPAPEKTVSSDGSNWAAENSVASLSDAYWYQIRQFVPWQSSNAYYQSFSIQDQLPAGTEYVGNAQVIREEDGKDMTGRFAVELTDGRIKVAAGSSLLGSKELYGYHFLIRFQARLNLAGLIPEYSENAVSYSVKNTAVTIYQHKTENSSEEKQSNEVTTKGRAERVEQEAPEKYLDETPGKTEKNLILRENEILFYVRQRLPENSTVFLPKMLTLNDRLAYCLEFRELNVERQRKGSDTFTTVENIQKRLDGEGLTVQVPLEAEDNGGTFVFQIRCRIQDGVDLSPWEQTIQNGTVRIQIPNEANVTVQWETGTPQSITKSTNQVQVYLPLNHIQLTKQIQAEDIVWAHGNPTFIFTLTGTDTSGTKLSWHQAVEFTKDKVPDSGAVSLTVDFEVPAGTYEASEEKTMRYQLEEICQVKNGISYGDTVMFKIKKGGSGSAVFVNRKTTDTEESDTALVRNKMGR